MPHVNHSIRSLRPMPAHVPVVGRWWVGEVVDERRKHGDLVMAKAPDGA
jgi:hypothetical protein